MRSTWASAAGSVRRRHRHKAVVPAAVILGLSLAGGGAMAVAQENTALPDIHTNEHLIVDQSIHNGFDIANVRQVFRHVLKSLPQRVRVYPTENYYYFYFYYGGNRYAGNIRLGVDTRDRKEVSFIYFKSTTGWQIDNEDNFATLGTADGVAVEKVEDLVYRVTDGDTSVVFALNDLRDVRPPEGALAKDEDYLGPVFDESGIRFFLVFDRRLATFHYVLDETVPVNDELFHPEDLKHVVLGRRTGFAFYADGVGNRKVLIAVYGPNVEVNNYYDGPFDQLPDNFIKGNELKEALLAFNPQIKPDDIDRFGHRKDSETRELIAPYMEYGDPRDLADADKCIADGKTDPVYQCLDEIYRR